MTGNRDKNHYDLFVPENLLSPRLRREFRILICFNSSNLNDMHNDMHKNSALGNGNKVNSQVLDKSKGYKSKLIPPASLIFANCIFKVISVAQLSIRRFSLYESVLV